MTDFTLEDFKAFQAQIQSATTLLEETREANAIPYPIMMGGAGKYIALAANSCDMSVAEFRHQLEMLIKDYERHKEKKE